MSTENTTEVLQRLIHTLQQRKVHIFSISKDTIRYKPFTLIRDDIEFMVNEAGFLYANFVNITFPTTKLSDNGTDEEYYLKTSAGETIFTVIINTSKGIISIYAET